MVSAPSMGCPSEETTRHWIVWVPAGSGSVSSTIASGPSTRGVISVSSSPSSSEIRATGLTSRIFAENVSVISSGEVSSVAPSSGSVAIRVSWAWAGGGVRVSASISAVARTSSMLGTARRGVREGRSTEVITPGRIRQGPGRQLSAPAGLACFTREPVIGRVPSSFVAPQPPSRTAADPCRSTGSDRRAASTSDRSRSTTSRPSSRPSSWRTWPSGPITALSPMPRGARPVIPAGGVWSAASTAIVESRARARSSRRSCSLLPGPAAQATGTSTAAGQRGERLGEADVVAGGQSQTGAAEIEGDQVLAGGDGLGLPGAVGVEQVNLAVVHVQVPAPHDHGVVDPAVVGRGEGAGRYREAVDLGQFAQQLLEGLVVLLGGPAQVGAEIGRAHV